MIKITKSDYRRTTPVSILMVDLGWRTLPERRKDACLNKTVCGKAAISVDKLKQSTKVTRSSDGSTFTAITTRTDAYKFSFFHRTVGEWNSLAPHSWLKLISTHSCYINI